MQARPGTLTKRHQTIDVLDAIATSSRNIDAGRDDLELIVATDAEEHCTIWLERTSRRVAAPTAQASS